MKSEQQFQPTLLADVNIQPPIESGIADAVSMMQFGKVLYKMYLYRAKGILVRYSDKNTHKAYFCRSRKRLLLAKSCRAQRQKNGFGAGQQSFSVKKPRKKCLRRIRTESRSNQLCPLSAGSQIHLYSLFNHQGKSRSINRQSHFQELFRTWE